MNKKEGIAVFVSLALLAYIFFSGPIMNLFNPESGEPEVMGAQTEQVGFQVVDEVVGTGAEATAGDQLIVHYTGRLTNGQVFDSSVDRGVPFGFVVGTGQVIRGWDEGLIGMRVGGKRVLTISPEYAYGNQAIGSIPANSTLIFEVELLDVGKPQLQSAQ
jgi:FKBP-type peptidyl-prolyl cis-trans isomerase